LPTPYKRRWAIELFFLCVKRTPQNSPFPRHRWKRGPHPDRRCAVPRNASQATRHNCRVVDQVLA
jgi:hypothetical protein